MKLKKNACQYPLFWILLKRIFKKELLIKILGELMIKPSKFYEALKGNGVDFFIGVPDSILKDFCAYVDDNSNNHVIAANEGNAVAIAAGYYLATRRPALVYMQNSGQGNAINPLVSLADPDVYSIPMVLLIGWRGEPGVKDEPQHVKQGRVTLSLLETLGIPYELLPKNQDEAESVLERAVDVSLEKEIPYALVVGKGTFEEYISKRKIENSYGLTREEAIDGIIGSLGEKDIIISTTGMPSRELFELRAAKHQSHDKDFLTVGSMGHASSIALGVAMNTKKDVYCLDGDGAAEMHMGAMAVIGNSHLGNFKHIILNNGCHDSVGGQSTQGFNINFPEIARACGYKLALRSDGDTKDLIHKLGIIRGEKSGPSLLEIRVKRGSRRDLGRPTTTPLQNRDEFMGNLKNE